MMMYNAYSGEYMRTISNKLKELRNKYKFTQKEVARKLGIKYQSYQAYELGKTVPNFDNLIKLADLYDVSLDYLVGRKEY